MTATPRRALTLARAAEDAALAVDDWATVSAARRAAGVAAMQLRDLDDAVRHLRASVSAGRRAGSRRLVGEAHMSLASALVLSGSVQEATREIGSALSELDGLAAARARIQRAAILQELGRLDEAIEDLRRALRPLRRAGDWEWVTRALSNRSLILTARRSFVAAEADLLSAQQLCAEHGLDLAGAYVEQNLGCVYAGRGDVPLALEHFDAAEQRYRAHELVVGSLLVDRAELLLSVRLVDEARGTAEAAVRAYEDQHRLVHLPEAKLLLSRIALVQGDGLTARVAAERATRSFAQQRRREWVALARYAHLQAAVADGDAEVSPARARHCAEELAASGWTVPALDAWVLAGRLALQRGQRSQARRDLALASRARLSGPAEARARAWVAEALLRKADGRRRAAMVALKTGLRIVEEHRATLGATELRAHVSLHRGRLARIGLRMALEDGDAQKVHWWAEKGRATASLLRPVRPPDDPALAADLEDLRVTVTEIEALRGAGRSTAALVARQVAIEHKIRDHCRRSPGVLGAQATSPPTARELSGELRGAALVEYIEVDGIFHAVSVVDGRMRLHRLGDADGVRRAMTHVPFALHRLANPHGSPGGRAAATAVLARAVETFEALLLRPLHLVLGDRPLVLVPTGALHSLPWSTLPYCAGRPVCVTPSSTLWLVAQSRRPAAAGSVVTVAGPGLPGAEDEAREVAALYPHARCLAGAEASAQAVSQAMDGAALAHVAAHGTLRSDNPLFSALLLTDGPFTVYDLERLESTPYHVVLAACDTGRSHVLAGEEILGLAAALLSEETATLVAPVIPIPDLEAAPLMLAYHGQLRSGKAPAEALALAQQQNQGLDEPAAQVAALGFLCLGAGLTPALPTPSIPAQATTDLYSRTQSVTITAEPVLHRRRTSPVGTGETTKHPRSSASTSPTVPSGVSTDT